MVLRSAKEDIVSAKPVWRLVRTAKLFSVETFFWLQHFPSISGCGDSRVCSASCLQLCLLEFWQAMIFPLHDWRFWFCVFLDTHAQIFRPSLLHVCDRYAFFVDASLFIYAFICVYIHLHLYGLFMLYVHVSTAF